MTFSDNIKQVRNGLGLDQKTFATHIGYSAKYLCDIEGERRNPSVEFVDKLCKALGASEMDATMWHVLGARAAGWRV